MSYGARVEVPGSPAACASRSPLACSRAGGFPRASARARPRSGFTLFELLLVLVILALGSAMIIPRAAPLSGRRLDSAIRHVLAASRHARSIAATRGARACLRFSAPDRRWWIEIEHDPFQAPGVFLPPADEWGAGGVLPEGVEFENVDADTVTFLPDGSAGDALVVFTGEGGERRAVEIRGYTGLARVLEEDEMNYKLQARQ